MDGRRKQWGRIKQEAPDVAAFLSAMGAEFGRLAAVRVELANGEVIESGQMEDGQVIWDGQMRRMRYG